MITVHIRKQGGAAIMTIPADVLKILNINIGATLELDIKDNSFVVHPIAKATRKRYALAELLRGATSKAIKALNKKTSWVQTGKSVGRELP